MQRCTIGQPKCWVKDAFNLGDDHFYWRIYMNLLYIPINSHFIPLKSHKSRSTPMKSLFVDGSATFWPPENKEIICQCYCLYRPGSSSTSAPSSSHSLRRRSVSSVPWLEGNPSAARCAQLVVCVPTKPGWVMLGKCWYILIYVNT